MPVKSGQGSFSIELLGANSCEQGYVQNTAVFVSVLTDQEGNTIEITDFAPRFQQYERVFRRQC